MNALIQFRISTMMLATAIVAAVITAIVAFNTMHPMIVGFLGCVASAIVTASLLITGLVAFSSKKPALLAATIQLSILLFLLTFWMPLWAIFGPGSPIGIEWGKVPVHMYGGPIAISQVCAIFGLSFALFNLKPNSSVE